MGNQMRKHIPEKDFEYLEKHTDFQKPDIIEFYKEFMVNSFIKYMYNIF